MFLSKNSGEWWSEGLTTTMFSVVYRWVQKLYHNTQIGHAMDMAWPFPLVKAMGPSTMISQAWCRVILRELHGRLYYASCKMWHVKRIKTHVWEKQLGYVDLGWSFSSIKDLNLSCRYTTTIVIKDEHENYMYRIRLPSLRAQICLPIHVQ